VPGTYGPAQHRRNAADNRVNGNRYF
jgi:hypothetical protein